MTTPQSNAAAPAVSLIVPCRNEVNYIDAFLGSVLAQQYPHDMEIIIADGQSDDGSRELLQRWQAKHPQIRVIDNPEKVVPTALNRAIDCARHDIIIRLDVHSEYADDYVAQCVAVLQQSGADNVGGPWRAAGNSYLQEAIALAFQSPYSSGAAASHNVTFEGEVDSVYLGCWRKASFDKFGWFDPELIRNQDDELNLRINRGGGRVYQSPAIQSRYYPRASLSALFRQYMQYGYWKVRVIQKHKLPASIRHLIPGLFVASLIVLALVGVFITAAAYLLLALLVLYFSALVAASLAIAVKQSAYSKIWVMPLVLAMFHIGYGWGFVRGVWDFLIRRKGHSQSFARLTRK